MPTVMIADFAGMLPLRDPILLPDNTAQLAENCWLYRGQIRGFRSADAVAVAAYADTQQIYRIPRNTIIPQTFRRLDHCGWSFLIPIWRLFVILRWGILIIAIIFFLVTNIIRRGTTRMAGNISGSSI